MRLTRFLYAEDRTLGRLECRGKAWWTLERPWLANKRSESCIPEGEYRLERYDSPTFGDRTWQVAEVPNRTFIAIHAANHPNQLEGCIALANGLHVDAKGVGFSQDAINEFYSLTAEENVMLIRITRGEVWI